MRIRGALRTGKREQADEERTPLFTPWGERLNPEHVLEEYPRPQMRRDNYTMLNGIWQYRIEDEKAGTVRPGSPFEPEGEILVPFSPECLLSGVNRQLLPGQRLWYQRRVSVRSPGWTGARCRLHFQAVDQDAKVYVNGALCAVHRGGYLPFEADITDQIGGRGSCLIQVCVRDISDTGYHARGKQKLERGGRFYTAQSGIWQSVWYEWTPDNAVRALRLTPDYDEGRLKVSVLVERPLPYDPVITVGAPELFTGKSVTERSTGRTEAEMPVVSRSEGRIEEGYQYVCSGTLPEGMPFRAWTPEEPYLYPMTVWAGRDRVQSYFALRVFSVEEDEEGIPRFCLNHEPLFLNGVLDSGYWSDGLMTAPADEALLFDLRLAKSMGFNMIRKHVKIESLRWYYHCDRLGLIVWQDMVNGGSAYDMNLVSRLPGRLTRTGEHFRDDHYARLSRGDARGRREWEEECRQTIGLLYNVPSLAVWVPFSEGWGQFDAARIAGEIHRQDPTRLIDHASGWFDQGAGDFHSVHSYSQKLRTEKPEASGRAFVLSEYGGLSCRIEGHSGTEKVCGGRIFETRAGMNRAYRALQEDVWSRIGRGLAGAVYSQLSDVEEEVDGLVTFDRRVVKLSPRASAYSETPATP